MKLVKVILDIQTNSFSNALTYALIEDNDIGSDLYDQWKVYCEQVEYKEKGEYKVEVGSPVIVPFGKQFKNAFIVDVIAEYNADFLSNADNIKPVLFATSNSFFDEDKVEFAKFLSEKYITSFATCLRMFIPGGALAKLKHVNNVWSVKSHHFRKISSEFLSQYFSESLIEHTNWSNFVLTDGQKLALHEIESSLEKSRNDVFVLDGVTGSGKTEVYLRAINKVLNSGKNAIVLVPEISLTPQIVSRFRDRFGEMIAVLHSKMTPSERFNQHERIKFGEARVVIGARSAMFSAINNIGIIVIDEEHEVSYKQDKAPRYNTRDCAEFLAKQNNAVLVLGSATPSFESLHNCEILDNWNHITLPERTNKKSLPNINVVDMGSEFKSGSKSMFSYKLKTELCSELKKGHKVVLLHNRRGFANYMFCRACGYTPKCPNCSTTLTYHQKMQIDNINKQMLYCHHCGHLEHVPITCPECDSPYIAKYGAGTQSVEEHLEALLADNEIKNVRIIRMDADTTKEKLGHKICLDEFAKPGAAVLLGTQMIAKGLDFEDVTLVGIVLADTNLTLPDFRSSERTFNLITQVAGRAGRADLEGNVIVQTYNPDSESIRYASSYNKQDFLAGELLKRKLLHYPPYYKLANIVCSGYDEENVLLTAQNVKNLLTEYKNKYNIEYIEISDASPCVLQKVRNRHRYHIIVKCLESKDISGFINNSLKTLKKKSSISMTIDIDPQNLF